MDPTGGAHDLLAAMRGEATPEPGAFTLTETFDDYCAFHSTVSMPVYQEGEPPFDDGGGGLALVDGVPQLQDWEEANLVITIPREPAPSGGYPTAVMIRTGGGGDRPLVDRGVRDAEGVVAIPGTGPAVHFARAGYAGVSVDGPHGGLRNVTGGDEQFLLFNITNPAAMRDNFRQSAAEIGLLADILTGLSFDASPCDGADATATLDAEELALFGHSMGATMAPVTVALEPRYRAVILSGAGGSWIENLIWKESPIEVRPVAESILEYGSRELHTHDPVISFVQWGGEPADPPVYGRELADDPRHVLMLQGIVDSYILPPIANATSLSMELDLAGEPLDADHPDLTHFRPLEEVLPFSERAAIDLPASGNGRDGVTAVVVQHAEDGIEDGHEVVFQTEGPKHQYRCFLESFRDGTPAVPSAGSEDDPCS